MFDSGLWRVLVSARFRRSFYQRLGAPSLGRIGKRV